MIAVSGIVALTGYLPFLNFTVNPSELVARALDKRDIATSLAIKSYLFEVSEEAVSRMTDIVYVNDPKAVIHLAEIRESFSATKFTTARCTTFAGITLHRSYR
eukprot:GEMP01101629.1.p1 GENE.GEMP01101629.1~~GEMP01101629.1.p1  ORF type:complete len:103 (+),score=10.87 GEMP01101629.1:158-466(+)